MVAILLQFGANPNARPNNEGPTVLHLAAREGWEFLADLLLNHGADPRKKDADQGWSARYWAFRSGFSNYLTDASP